MYPHADDFLRTGKFTCRFDQWLYCEIDPDDYCGDSTDGAGWFGKFGPRRIMLEQTNGFVIVRKYDTAEACDADWQAILDNHNTDEEWI